MHQQFFCTHTDSDLRQSVKKTSANKPIIGWREWVSLPDLKIKRIKAKIDTGARTSVLHAFDIKPFNSDGEPWVRFDVHPVQRDDTTVIRCEARIVNRRMITNSGGTRELRYLVKTLLCLGESVWPIELTLSNRDQMGFRMLIGRTALKGRVIVDPSVSFCESRFIPRRATESVPMGDRITTK